MIATFTAKKIMISGIVQGVGFRPFIYKMARSYGLVGEVSNSTSGVDILVEGSLYSVDSFLKSISNKIPPIARIDNVYVDTVPLVGFDSFSIAESRVRDGETAIISPDVSVCLDCLVEINDPNNRRYRYPFTNCTNCGPRYTIVKDVPYDRQETSMDSFTMCSMCQTEYDDPGNRRFHAQPNACAACGPLLWLTDSKGEVVVSADPIVTVSEYLKEGSIVAIKGLGGFHLVVDATNESAVKRLRKRKHRKDKPFAIMSVNMKNIRSYAVVKAGEENLLTGLQKPIVLLEKANTSLIAKAVSPNNRCIGVMLPYTPLHYLLFDEGFLALVMTSGNLSGQSIVIENEKAIECLGEIADYFLMHDRDILVRSDDSVLRRYGGKTRVIRRSRGYVPLPINLANSMPSVLACGAEMKNTICLTRGDNAFMSQHIGDLKSKSTYDFFQNTVTHMQRILKITPDIVVCDYNPDYMSSYYALKCKNMEVVRVQHHHAHIAACMAENKIKDPVIGLAFDGTGIGSDGTIWGGEVLIADYVSFERVAYLEAVAMPGSSMAIREPWRMALSYLYNAFGDALLNLPLLNSINEGDIRVLINMICKKINTPYTSSLGRFFDGVAAITGIRNKVSFEGQAAMEFEALAVSDIYDQYDFAIDSQYEFILMTSPIVKGIVADIINGVPIGVIAAKFHNTIISMFGKVCLMLKKAYNIKRVALSGGVFQNTLLMTGLKNELEKNSFEVLTHRLVPFNDGGISLGQVVVASHLT